MLTLGALNQLPGIRHGFFTREGGVSSGVYASLNCGFGSGDDRACVAENRERAMRFLELTGEQLVTCYQIHSDRVVEVTAPWSREDSPEADAMVSRTPGIALGVLAADCAPVLFADAEAGVVGAAHAGWKGALGGVVERTLEAMTALGATVERIRVGIGPAIAQRSYEVGPEFRERFMADSANNADFFCPARREGHFHFDLKGYVARRASTRKVKAVEVLPCDTLVEEARFFSYRRACLRGEKEYGRGLSAICLGTE
jgi:YfiH family protein